MDSQNTTNRTATLSNLEQWIKDRKQAVKKHRITLAMKAILSPVVAFPALLILSIVLFCIFNAETAFNISFMIAFVWVCVASVRLIYPDLKRFNSATLTSKQTAGRLKGSEALSTFWLCQIEDAAAVGLLCEALEFADDPQRSQISTSLLRLLPGLNFEDAGLLKASHRIYLYSMLQPCYAREEPERLIAILRALENIQDLNAISPVTELLAYRLETPSAGRIQEAARSCLTVLKEAQRTKNTSGMLLRASAQPTGGADVLLRPASSTVASPPEELLRSSQASQEP